MRRDVKKSLDAPLAFIVLPLIAAALFNALGCCATIGSQHVCLTAPTPSPTPTLTPAPRLATATQTAEPTATQPAVTPEPTATFTPVPAPTWVTRLIRVNGFHGCNPDRGPGRTACHGDRTFWFTMPGFDVLSREDNCRISCARRPNGGNCLASCNRNDSTGTPCGGAPACDADHLSCERVRVGCNGHAWDDPRGSMLKATGDGFSCSDADDHYGFDCTGTPGSQYMLCARPFADAHTADGTPILVQGTGEFCAAGVF